MLEEGKGNRWHKDCFRCDKCGTFLDQGSDLLLLGDGSLFCNSCTNSCSVCNSKIEVLAILIGDQVSFCATSFKCRICKKKFENLKYARTSQGIFCKICHKSLVGRRWRKARAQKFQPKLTVPKSPTTVQHLIESKLPLLRLPETSELRDPVFQAGPLVSAPSSPNIPDRGSILQIAILEEASRTGLQGT